MRQNHAQQDFYGTTSIDKAHQTAGSGRTDPSLAGGDTAEDEDGEDGDPAQLRGSPPPPPVSPHRDIDRLRRSTAVVKSHSFKGDQEDQQDRKDQEHLWTLQELSRRFAASGLDPEAPARSRGLCDAEVSLALAKHGPNRLTPAATVPEWVKFARQFRDPFLLLLLAAAILSTVSYAAFPDDDVNLYVALALYVIVVLTATLAFVQERQSSAVMGMLGAILAESCIVVRDGTPSEIETAGLVPGDLVRLTAGSKCPADVRLVSSSGVRVDSSALTGESEPVDCNATACAPGTGVLDASCIVLNGSFVLEGSGLALVIRTGDRSMVGRLAITAGRPRTEPTTMQIEIAAFVKFVTILALTMAMVFFAVGVARTRGDDWISTFVSGFLVVIVANVPQGLPATVTSLLTVTAKAMAERNVSVKRLDAIESLGSTSIIASDKTGTLTTNNMSVQEVYIDGSTHGASDLSAICPALPSRPRGRPSTELQFLAIAAICNSARRSSPNRRSNDNDNDNVDKAVPPLPVRSPSTRAIASARLTALTGHTYTGNASDIALRRLAEALLPDPTGADGRDQGQHDDHVHVHDHDGAAVWTAAERGIVLEIPFSSATKFQAAVLTGDIGAHVLGMRMGTMGGRDDALVVIVKGAAERILARCVDTCTSGAPSKMTKAQRAAHTRVLEDLVSRGRRVLALAFRWFDATSTSTATDGLKRADVPLEGLCFVGFAALIDPPRAEVPPAIATCAEAGIRVFMVTGDHVGTAVAIAREIGIIPAASTSRALESESDSDDSSLDSSRSTLSSASSSTSSSDSSSTSTSISTSHRAPGIVTIVSNAGVGGTAALVQQPPSTLPAWCTDPTLPIVVDGHDAVAALRPCDWDEIMSRSGGCVFARMTPDDKLLIVEECKSRGGVVAVTGDGVNDAPALRAAHVGVAMGVGGSDVAREAAAVVLLDNSFASLVQGIRQGRRIFDNLKKTIGYTLTHLVPEILPVLLALALGVPAGLSSLSVLSIDLLTELAPAISLAYEDAEGDVMRRPPRNLRRDRLVSGPLVVYSYVVAGMIEAAACLGAFLWVFSLEGIGPSTLLFADTEGLFDSDADPYCPGGGRPCLDADDQVAVFGRASAAWYITLVVAQSAFHLWTCKTLRLPIARADYGNPLSYYGSALALALMAVFAFVPGVSTIMGFGNVPTAAIVAVTAAAAGVALIATNEIRKYTIRSRPASEKWLKW